MKYFSFFGICFDLMGAILILIGVFVTKEKAINIGTPHLGPNDPQKRSQIPLVKSLLEQRNYAIGGTVALAIGFALQAYVAWPF